MFLGLFGLMRGSQEQGYPMVYTDGSSEKVTGVGHVANLPNCGPHLILSAALKRRGFPRQDRLCSQSAQLWVIYHFVLRSEAAWTPV